MPILPQFVLFTYYVFTFDLHLYLNTLLTLRTCSTV